MTTTNVNLTAKVTEPITLTDGRGRPRSPN